MGNKCKCGKTIPENSSKCDACKRKTIETGKKIGKILLTIGAIVSFRIINNRRG